MPPADDSDWSDSEVEDLSDEETSVLLGVADGPITVSNDIVDVAVSRIGGIPAFLPSDEPDIASAACKMCNSTMELLVQMWCPFQDSPMDRALYVWGCSRAGCQGKPGSVRAWRGLRYNEEYAKKLEKKLAREKKKEAERLLEKQRAEVEAKRKASQANPFSMKATTPGPFGLGDQLFGGVKPTQSTPQQAKSEDQEGDGDEGGEGDEDSDSESLVVALASTRITESKWSDAPSYPPLYLSTVSEYIPARPAPTPSEAVKTEVTADGSADVWNEVYENSMNLDQVFERFSKRVQYEGEQCVRYDQGGVPLPFSSDATFHALFPSSDNGRRTYTPTNSVIPSCPLCGSARVFECQLMPNLINVLRKPSESPDTSKLTDDERRKMVEYELKGGEGSDSRGLDWGTCLIFSCEKDCCREGSSDKQIKECWREELVIIQKDE